MYKEALPVGYRRALLPPIIPREGARRSQTRCRPPLRRAVPQALRRHSFGTTSDHIASSTSNEPVLLCLRPACWRLASASPPAAKPTASRRRTAPSTPVAQVVAPSNRGPRCAGGTCQHLLRRLRTTLRRPPQGRPTRRRRHPRSLRAQHHRLHPPHRPRPPPRRRHHASHPYRARPAPPCRRSLLRPRRSAPLT